MVDYRSRSLWLDQVPGDLAARPPLGADIDVDVAIVGAGYTGLWTAYYLAKADPKLRIAVLEQEIAGFGASGRNGGWCSCFFAASYEKMARTHGRQGAIDMQRAMFATVDEVGRVADEEGIDCHYHKGGSLGLVTAPAQLPRMREELEYYRSWGFGEEDYRWVDQREAQERLKVSGGLGGLYGAHCAAVQPALLARGLADAVERLEATIYEGTRVLDIEKGLLTAAGGRVRAETIVRATEAYTVDLPNMRRALVPMYSLMIATEPLPKDFWDEIGWSGYETVNDGRHFIIYAMRTEDDRIAIGGRGAPYRLGSRIDDRFERVPRVFERLRGVVRELFPSIGEFAVTHTWGGPFAIPRDWYTSVGYDRTAAMAWASGYVGDGVATTNLAGRTIADLVLGHDSDIVRLPWVNHHSRQWEPEPLRWLGVNLAMQAMASADRAEARTGKPAKRADYVTKLIGR